MEMMRIVKPNFHVISKLGPMKKSRPGGMSVAAAKGASGLVIHLTHSREGSLHPCGLFQEGS